MRSHQGLRFRSTIRCALIPAMLGAALSSVPVTAQQTRVQQAQKKVTDLIALYDAEDHKSPLCKGFIGKVVMPSSFSALALRLSPPAAKGEFETTAQYNARVAGTSSQLPQGPVVVTLPTDREYINYDADSGMMVIRAGAFSAGEVSDLIHVQITAYTLVPDGISGGTPIPLGRSERLLRTYTARNGLGMTAKVTEIERLTNALYLASPRLFSFTKDEVIAKDANVPVMAILSVPPVQAQRLKQTLRVALAIIPKTPYIFTAEGSAAVPTLREPVQYEDKVTAIYADATCALSLDGQGLVLAAVDAGA